jgi:hypothetical protein
MGKGMGCKPSKANAKVLHGELARPPQLPSLTMLEYPPPKVTTTSPMPIQTPIPTPPLILKKSPQQAIFKPPSQNVKDPVDDFEALMARARAAKVESPRAIAPPTPIALTPEQQYFIDK